MVHPAIAFLIAIGLTLAIAAGIVAACHGILWLFRKRDAAKPRLLVVTAAWMIAALTIEGYEIWRRVAADAQANAFNPLATQAMEEAKRIAKSKGEDVSLPAGYSLPAGPIFQKEYAERYLKAVQQTPRPLDLSWVESVFLPLWVICGLGVAGYYFSVLRKQSGWFWPLVVSATLASFQFFAILIPVAVLSFILGGSE